MIGFLLRRALQDAARIGPPRGQRLTLIQSLCTHFTGVVYPHQCSRVLPLRSVEIAFADTLGRLGPCCSCGGEECAQSAVETDDKPVDIEHGRSGQAAFANRRSSSAPGSSALMNASPTRK